MCCIQHACSAHFYNHALGQVLLPLIEITSEVRTMYLPEVVVKGRTEIQPLPWLIPKPQFFIISQHCFPRGNLSETLMGISELFLWAIKDSNLKMKLNVCASKNATARISNPRDELADEPQDWRKKKSWFILKHVVCQLHLQACHPRQNSKGS